MKHSSLIFAVIGVTSAFVVEHPFKQKDSFALYVAEPKQAKTSTSVSNRNPLTPAQRLLIKTGRKDDVSASKATTSKFDKIKNAAYAVGDGLTSLGGRASNRKDKIFDGYADMRGRNSVSSSPTQRLLAMLKKRPPPSEVVEVKVKPTPTRSIFDSFKGALYGTADLASSVATRAAVSATTEPSEPAKPAAKIANPNTQIVLRRDNPFERLKADVQANIDKLQSDVNAVAEFLSSTASDIQAAPVRLQSFVEETVDKTMQAVDDVKALPNKVQEQVDGAVETVEGLSTSAKVLLGLEKPKPRPPNSAPPKPAGTKELAWKVAGSVLTGAGKAFWWMGSSAAGATFSAVKGKIQADSLSGSSPTKPAFLSSKLMEMAASRVTANDAAEQLVAAKRFESLAKEDETLNLEIAEALRLANDAISATTNEDEKLNLEIAEALQLANDALSATTKEDEKLNQEIAEALQLANEALSVVSEAKLDSFFAPLDDDLNLEIEAALRLAEEALAAADEIPLKSVQ